MIEKHDELGIIEKGVLLTMFDSMKAYAKRKGLRLRVGILDRAGYTDLKQEHLGDRECGQDPGSKKVLFYSFVEPCPEPYIRLTLWEHEDMTMCVVLPSEKDIELDNVAELLKDKILEGLLK